LWGYFRKWLEGQEIDKDSHPYLLIYLQDRNGAYYMHGPKLYFKHDLGDPGFSNTEQDMLQANYDLLGEVHAFMYKQRGQNPKHWNSFPEFIHEITGVENV